MAKAGLAARAAALTLLSDVLDEGALLSEANPRSDHPDLEPQDRARAQRLATTTLRWLPRADAVLDRYVKRRPPAPALHVLRLAIVELCVDGAAAHGVVDAAVTLTGRSKGGAKLKGLVNAVLRKVAREGPEIWPTLPIPGLPKWIADPVRQAYGKAALRGIEAAHVLGAPLDVTPLGDPKAVADALGGQLLPTGSVRLTDAGQVSALPGFEDGQWWVQDAAAAVPVRLFGDLAGRRALDLCAAPGGKTLQMAAAGANVTSVDLSEHRMARVVENLTRTGLSATTVVADALAFETDAPFDAVLLDAPCSATGTVRRHPDLPYTKSGRKLDPLLGLQRDLIGKARQLVRSGGQIVFCTCSLLPAEGADQVAWALETFDDLKIDPVKPNEVPGLDAAIDARGCLRLRPDLWPELGGMDGFFVARLTKGG